jgi:hypothetical protein
MAVVMGEGHCKTFGICVRELPQFLEHPLSEHGNSMWPTATATDVAMYGLGARQDIVQLLGLVGAM